MAKTIDYDDPCLCEDHAAAYGMKPGMYREAAKSDDPTDPVDCDACSTALMRKAGAL